MTYKLGSLFDGSGGFPLSGALCGIEPAWAAEVEPYPIAVTRSRFPNMKHLGDISKVNGADIEPVDIITFGSPCQDLSVAGKRAGLKHEANGDEETTRSGLFMEAVRIIKERRAATNGEYPRFALWENVPGAFSSNKGEDFRIVCEELIKIVEPAAFMPEVPQKGWAYSDSYIGNRWSLAYRVFDAQYWGVPQRRRRIHLVVDFRGECAREILFEREGVRGYFAQGRTPWQVPASYAQDCSGADDCPGASQGADGGRQLAPVTLEWQTGAGHTMSVTENLSPCLRANTTPGVVYDVDQGGGKSGAHHYEEMAPTLTCTHGGEPAVAYTPKVRSGCDVDSAGKSAGKGALVQTEKAATLACVQDQYLFQPTAILDNIGGQAEYGKVTHVNGTLRSAAQGAVAFAMGPKVFKADDGSTGDAVPTLVGDHNNRVTDHTALVAEPVFSLDEKMGQTYVWAGQANTLAARDYKQPQAVCFQTYQDVTGPLMANSHPGSYTGQDAFSDMLVAGPTPQGPIYTIDCESFNCGQNFARNLGISDDGVVPTLKAVGPGAIAHSVAQIHYIVRRLTPTECARLQGFADQHGHLEQKTDLTDEEHSFWMEVRNTHAAINGKAVKDYTKAQMLTWYNKLWTDSAEYKMWGNGIALPPALYCMQGIMDVLNREEDDSWML